MQDFGLVPSNDVEAVKKHLATVGPLAVNVDASSFALVCLIRTFQNLIQMVELITRIPKLALAQK